MPAMIDIVAILVTILAPLVPAILLYRSVPSTGQASGALAGVNFKLGGAVAGYVVIFLIAILFLKPMTISSPRYEIVKMQGTVEVGGVAENELDMRSFRMSISPRQWGQEGTVGPQLVRWTASVPKKINPDGKSPWFFDYFVVSYDGHQSKMIPVNGGTLLSGIDTIDYGKQVLEPVRRGRASEIILSEAGGRAGD